MAKGSSEELRRSFDIVIKTTYLVGINLFQPNREVNARFVISVLIPIAVYSLCIYTAWAERSEWQAAIQVFVPLMLDFMGTGKLWLGFVRKHSYYLLFVKTEEIYAEYDANERNKPELKKAVTLLIQMIKAMVFVYSGLSVLVFITLMLIILVTNEKFLMIRFYIPFVDHTTLSGYAITMSIHVFLCAYCVNGFLAADSAFLVTVVPLIGYANSFKNEVDALNQLLEKPTIDKRKSSEQLMRMVKLHQMIVGYEMSAIELFKASNLVQTAFQAGTILILGFMGLALHYYQALGVLAAIFFELTLHCSLGTILTAKHDQMTTDIYNINWHLVPKAHQQLIAFMLQRAQNARDLCVGDFAPLNMATYVQILKMVYTFFTMLITVMDAS